MNFFKSVFSDDPDPPGSESDSDSDNHRSDESSGAGDGDGVGVWNFGGLMKTLTEKSESIIDIYRRDLQEFGTGLKKEMEVAQGSLETVGHVIDQFGNTVAKGTAQIISQGKDVILESDSDNKKKNGAEKSLELKGYSRFDSQIRAIQGDASTYAEAPEDLDEYNMWKSEFSLEGKSEEMEGFLRETDDMESVYKRFVPNTVDSETFWYRYYYKVYKLKKAEDVRARLVRRMSREEEELSWDVEDDDQKEEEEEHVDQGKPQLVIENEVDGGFDANNVVGTEILNVEEVHNFGEEESKVEKRDNLLQSKELGNKMVEFVDEAKVDKKSEVVQEMGDGSKETIKEELDNTGNRNDSAAADSDKKVVLERKAEDGKSSLLASQHSGHEEDEDLEWDEIEDLGSINEKKATRSGSPGKVDLRKRLNAAEDEEEDLSWDIEDDDDPAKA
ncbi:BSD domain-containing protein C22A12.14c [Gastrolobium bilobum]|uniref:BSD domain-containing protein C22A12.14c n=1 Tax=Gastrolobium bilobum TaxID=150636 RepID=UPI002AB05849|nr:BSD domain-containing protein C22A12.14c [Gastrolobium bilobum]